MTNWCLGLLRFGFLSLWGDGVQVNKLFNKSAHSPAIFEECSLVGVKGIGMKFFYDNCFEKSKINNLHSVNVDQRQWISKLQVVKKVNACGRLKQAQKGPSGKKATKSDSAADVTDTSVRFYFFGRISKTVATLKAPFTWE